MKLAEEKKAVKKKRKLLEGSAAGGEKGHVQVSPPRSYLKQCMNQMV